VSADPKFVADLSQALVHGFMAAFVCGLLSGWLISLLWERLQFLAVKRPVKARMPRKPRKSKAVSGELFPDGGGSS